jgi:hypothetical protein
MFIKNLPSPAACSAARSADILLTTRLQCSSVQSQWLNVPEGPSKHFDSLRHRAETHDQCLCRNEGLSISFGASCLSKLSHDSTSQMFCGD